MAKSVIEVDIVGYDKFMAFAEAFEKFQKTLKDAQEKLDKIGKVAEEAGNKGKKSFEATKKELDNLNRSAQSVLTPLTKIGSVVADVAKSAASTALSFAKWIAFGALGTGFGLGALARGAVGTETQARGYGISSGALRAARTAYSPLGIDVEGMLSTLTQAKYEPSKYAAFQQLGIKPQAGQQISEMSSLDIMNQALRGLQGKQITYGTRQLLSQIGLGAEDINRIQGIKSGALEPAIAMQQKLAPKYETNEAGWMKFQQSISAAGETIETSLIRNLSKLAPVLGDLANQIAGAIDSFAQSGGFQKMLDTAVSGIKEFGKYIGSGEFQANIKKFAEVLWELTQFLMEELNALRHPLATTTEAISKTASFWLDNAKKFGDGSYAETHLTSAQKQEAAKFAQAYNLPKGVLENVMQSLAGTGAFYGQKNASYYTAKTQQAGQTLSAEMSRFAGDKQQLLKAISAYIIGDTEFDKLLKAKPTTWQLDSRVQNVQSIVISNNTGGSAVVSAPQLQGATGK